jgi:kinetochore protein Nuf2
MKLMKSAGVAKFSLRDLWAPEPKRTRDNLSALINFARFREERSVKYMELQEKSVLLPAQKPELFFSPN